VDDPEAASTEHRSECHCPHPGLVANDFATSRRPRSVAPSVVTSSPILHRCCTLGLVDLTLAC